MKKTKPGPETYWTRDRVIAAIQERSTAGLPLNATEVIRTAQPLYGAARRSMGSWRAAIQAAKAENAKASRDNRHPRGYWTSERIKQLIEDRISKGVDLSSSGVQREDPKLYAAAVHYFRSWPEALRRIGSEELVEKSRRRPAPTPSDPEKRKLPGGSLANRVRIRRRELGLTQRDLARIADLSDNEVQLIESGRRGDGYTMQVGTAIRLARALGIGLDEFF